MNMKARVGDHVVLQPRQVGDRVRRGRVVDIRGSVDTPLYIVRWPDGHESVYSTDSDVTVEHADDDDRLQPMA
jgi:hypothetical protein